MAVGSDVAAGGRTSAHRPLNGITVVTLEHAIAAAFATRQLADLGCSSEEIDRLRTSGAI